MSKINFNLTNYWYEKRKRIGVEIS